MQEENIITKKSTRIYRKKFCELCRSFITGNHFSRHKKTKKHQLLQELSKNPVKEDSLYQISF